MDWSEAVSLPLSGCGVGMCDVGLLPSYQWSQGISSPKIGLSGHASQCQWSFQRHKDTTCIELPVVVVAIDQ